MAGRQEKNLAGKKKEQLRELGARGTVAAVKSYMSSDGTGPYGVRSVSCFRGAHWRPCVCMCAVVESLITEPRLPEPHFSLLPSMQSRGIK